MRVANVHMLSENYLAGKKIVFYGDSLCFARSETEETLDRGWPYRVGSRNGMEWYNMGVGGASVTADIYNAAGIRRFCLSREIDRILDEHSDMDYFVFEGGGNDANPLTDHPERWGTVDESDFSGNYDDTTFCGAFESLIFKVLTRCPSVRTGYIVATKMGMSNAGYGMQNAHYRFFSMAMSICRKWGVPYLNMWDGVPLNPMLRVHYNSELDSEANRAAGSMYIDGTHLTAKGYDMIADRINAFVKSL